MSLGISWTPSLLVLNSDHQIPHEIANRRSSFLRVNTGSRKQLHQTLILDMFIQLQCLHPFYGDFIPFGFSSFIDSLEERELYHTRVPLIHPNLRFSDPLYGWARFVSNDLDSINLWYFESIPCQTNQN